MVKKYSQGVDTLSVFNSLDKKLCKDVFEKSLEKEGLRVLISSSLQVGKFNVFYNLISESHAIFINGKRKESDDYFGIFSLYSCVEEKPGTKALSSLCKHFNTDKVRSKSDPIVVNPMLSYDFRKDYFSDDNIRSITGVLFTIDPSNHKKIEDMMFYFSKETCKNPTKTCSKVYYVFDDAFSSLIVLEDKVNKSPIIVSCHTYPEFDSAAFTHFSFYKDCNPKDYFETLADSMDAKDLCTYDKSLYVEKSLDSKLEETRITQTIKQKI